MTLGNGQNNSVTNLVNLVKDKQKAGSGRTGLVGWGEHLPRSFVGGGQDPGCDLYLMRLESHEEGATRITWAWGSLLLFSCNVSAFVVLCLGSSGSWEALEKTKQLGPSPAAGAGKNGLSLDSSIPREQQGRHGGLSLNLHSTFWKALEGEGALVFRSWPGAWHRLSQCLSVPSPDSLTCPEPWGHEGGCLPFLSIGASLAWQASRDSP